MNAVIGNFESGAVAVRAGKGPQINQTYWGYTVAEGDRGQKRGRAFEFAGKLIGAGFLMAAAGMWVLPTSLHGPDMMIMKLGVTVLFLMIGAVMVWNARNGFNDELQVDLVRQELRMGQRNAAGDCRLTAMLRFGEVGSVYLMRSKAKGEPARLFLRVGDSDRALEVAQGPAERLEAIKDRLMSDLAAGRDASLRKRSARKLMPAGTSAIMA